MDELKYQELLDAANHAEHNGGRVMVDHVDLKDLLAVWIQVTPSDVVMGVPAQSSPEVSAADLDAVAEEQKAKEDTSGNPPEPTVQ